MWERGNLGDNVSSKPSLGGSCGSTLSCHLCPWGIDPWFALRGWRVGSELDGWLDGSPGDQLPPHRSTKEVAVLEKWSALKLPHRREFRGTGKSTPLGMDPWVHTPALPLTSSVSLISVTRMRRCLAGLPQMGNQTIREHGWGWQINRWVRISR